MRVGRSISRLLVDSSTNTCSHRLDVLHGSQFIVHICLSVYAMHIGCGRKEPKRKGSRCCFLPPRATISLSEKTVLRNPHSSRCEFPPSTKPVLKSRFNMLLTSAFAVLCASFLCAAVQQPLVTPSTPQIGALSSLAPGSDWLHLTSSRHPVSTHCSSC